MPSVEGYDEQNPPPGFTGASYGSDYTPEEMEKRARLLAIIQESLAVNNRYLLPGEWDDAVRKLETATTDDLGWPKRYEVWSQDIRLSEETVDFAGDEAENFYPHVKRWTASIEAPTHRDTSGRGAVLGPWVSMSRTGRTADEAFKNLVSALEEQEFTVVE